MKISHYLVGVALLCSAPTWAQDHKQPVAEPVVAKSDWGTARQTWYEARQQTRALDALIAAKKLLEVHDAALNLRDTVRELRFGWDALAPKQKSAADTKIRQIDGLLDGLHESADHNDLKGVVQNQRTLHVLLDGIAAAFPTGALIAVGPITATASVRDPYCRMVVDPATAAARVAVGGQTYYFCSANEAKAFQQHPAPYVALYDELTFGLPKIFDVALNTGGKVVAGHPSLLTFAIREKGHTALTTQFQAVHEKMMHLIAVSDDLSWFAHEHPQLARDGRFYMKQTFARDGRYFLFADFTPANGSNMIVRSEVRVGSGINRQPQKLVSDQVLSKIVDGVKVDVKLSAPLQAGKAALLTYTLSRDGKPVTDMVPYLAAMGHMMAIHQNGQDAVHTHSVSEGSDPLTDLSVTSQMSTPSGPTQTFRLLLPRAGTYRVWAQFGLPNHVLTVPFTFSVQELTMKITRPIAVLTVTAATMGGAQLMQAAPKTAQKVTVTLPLGYRDSTATVKAGQPVALTFFLKSDAGCGNTIALPAAKWKKTLKVGERATVVYTPKKSGTLLYECGMGHLKGNLTVK